MQTQMFLSMAMCPFCDDWMFFKAHAKMKSLRCIKCQVECPTLHVLKIPGEEALMQTIVESLIYDRKNNQKNTRPFPRDKGASGGR